MRSTIRGPSSCSPPFLFWMRTRRSRWRPVFCRRSIAPMWRLCALLRNIACESKGDACSFHPPLHNRLHRKRDLARPEGENTLNLRHFVPGSLLALSLLIGAGALATHAKDNQAGGKDAPLTASNVARVDMDSVFDASDAPTLMEQKATETGKATMDALTRITNSPYLEQQ